MATSAYQGRTVPPAALFALAAGIQHLMASRRTDIAGAVVTLALSLAAGWFGLGSVAEFRKQETTVTPMDVEKASSLVVSGPNAMSRNPMYVALLLLLIANAARRGSWSGLVPAAAFAALINAFQIPKEELALERAFGAEYEMYRATTPRWLGI